MRAYSASLVLGLALAACSSNATTTVTCTVSAVAITGAPATLTVGATATLTANVTQQNCTSNPVAWGTSNATVLSVNLTGTVTAVAAGGPVTITATSGGQQGTAQISVTAAPVSIVTVVPDSMVLAVGTTGQLSAVTRAVDSTVLTGRTIVWAPGSAAIATVNAASGLVTAVTAGSTTVTATSETRVGTAKIFSATPRVVYFWNNFPTPVGSQTPSAGYSFSSGAGTMSVSSGSTGSYSLAYANFARAGAETEAVFVTSYGGSYCTVSGWGSEIANINCFASSGSLANSDFDFLVVGSATFGGRFAYAWANTTSPSVPYQPHYLYRFSSSNQPITITKMATGIYSVLFAGQGRVLSTDREALMVSAYGGTAVSCQSSNWITTGADLTATIYCFSAAGAATDQQFDIALVSLPRAGANLAFVDADQPSNTTPYAPTNAKVLPTGSVAVTRTGTGAYNVLFTGLVRTGTLKESFQISAVGTSLVHCFSAGWGFDGSGATSSVSCTTPAGVPVDSRFVMVGVQ